MFIFSNTNQLDLSLLLKGLKYFLFSFNTALYVYLKMGLVCFGLSCQSRNGSNCAPFDTVVFGGTVC